MYKANFVIGKNYNKYTTTEEQIKGLTEKKFFTLKGAMRFIEKNNFEMVMACEKNEKARQTYKENFGEKYDLENETIFPKDVTIKKKKDIPDFDILVKSPLSSDLFKTATIYL